MHTRIRIIIADDHPTFIAGIKEMLLKESVISIVGEALNGKQVLAILQKKQADIVLLDDHMLVLNGIEAMKTIRGKYPEIKIILMTEETEPKPTHNLLNLKANGYLQKKMDKEEIPDAIKTVYHGGRYYSPRIKSVGMDILEGQKIPFIDLSDLEIKILRHASKGMKSKQIAVELHESIGNIYAHRKAIVRKLGANSFEEAIAIAVRDGLLD